MQRHFYEVGDKANKLLAWLEKRDRCRSWVTEIRDETGGRHTTEDTIAQAFATYYEHTYSSMTAQTYVDCMEFFGDIPLVEILATDREASDQDLTVEEVQRAMVETQLGKAWDLMICQ
ncbi:hypothetical protein NDU88_007139 [Pleurodeles waltl]|uniref:Uncharacterized protein n=1 Tax=Pleurodeles waltl TaxID=8319 RepID=A0AAV7SS05_PLEWA|nr:hypothetical protein NDU88_007139 [Pleurodeles waltl]